MGLLLASELSSLGHDVSGYDPSPDAARRAASSGIKVVEGPEPWRYDAVLAAVPLERSAEVAREVYPRIRGDGAYVDVSTLKSEVNGVLRSLGGGAAKVSVHPLFGRGARGLAGRPVALTPVEDVDRELAVARELFRGADLIVMDEARHDEAVPYSILLPPVLGYLFAYASSSAPSIPSTSRRLQELAAAVELDEPELTAQLILRSPASREVLRRLEEGLRGLMASSDPAQLLRSVADGWRGREELYEMAYRALGSL